MHLDSARSVAVMLSLLACSLGSCGSDPPREPAVGGASGANASASGTGGGGWSASGGAGGSAAYAPMPRPMSLEGTPIYTRFMRLTNEQYQRSVQDILGLSAIPDAAKALERPVAGTTDFANNEHVLSVTNALWASYQLAAEQAVQLVVESTSTLSALYNGNDPNEFIRKVGRRAFRRPLGADEIERYAALFA